MGDQDSGAAGRPRTAASLTDLGIFYALHDRRTEAEQLCNEALERMRRQADPDSALVSCNLVCLAALRGQSARALEALRAVVEAGGIPA